MPAAIGIAVLSFADTALTGRNFAEPHGERTDPNRELVALSAADLGASLTSGYPISSSASRTQAAEAAGAQTQLAGIIAAGTVALVLLFLTGPLALLPIPALGAIVLAGALHFIKAGEIARIWRIQPSEGAIAIVAAACVVLYGTLVGVGVAALMAAFNVFRRAAKPHIAELGRLDHDDFADIERSPSAIRTPGVLIVRFAGPLFFATATALGDRIRELAANREPLSTVILDAYAVVDLDLTATDAVRTIERELAKSGTALVIARPTGALRDLMRTFGVGHLAPAHGIRSSLAEAVDAASAARGADAGSAADAGSGTTLDAGPAGPESGPTVAPPAPVPAPWPPTGDRPEPARSRPKIGVVAIAAIAVVAVVVAAIALGERGSGIPPAGEVVTPNLIGIPLDRARSVSEAAGLVLGPATYRQTDAYPELTVISQDPGPGTPIVAGSSITPTVSTARAPVAIPDVAGSPQSDAIVAITSAGLRVGSTVRQSDGRVPAGAVIATEPAAGRLVAVGTDVAIIVSSGPAEPPRRRRGPVVRRARRRANRPAPPHPRRRCRRRARAPTRHSPSPPPTPS